jgi:hypothetical protein
MRQEERAGESSSPHFPDISHFCRLKLENSYIWRRKSSDHDYGEDPCWMQGTYWLMYKHLDRNGRIFHCGGNAMHMWTSFFSNFLIKNKTNFLKIKALYRLLCMFPKDRFRGEFDNGERQGNDPCSLAWVIIIRLWVAFNEDDIIFFCTPSLDILWSWLVYKIVK